MSDDVSIEEAAVELGMSPTAVTRLLDSGQMPWHLEPGGRRRMLKADLATHREVRFKLRQQRVEEQRTRRWAEPEADELPV